MERGYLETLSILKSAAMFYIKQKSIYSGSELFNKVLGILEAQGAENLQEFKVGVPKKIKSSF